MHAWGWYVVNYLIHDLSVTCQLTLHFSRGERVHFIWPPPINMWSQAVYMHVHTLTYMYMHVQCSWFLMMYCDISFLGVRVQRLFSSVQLLPFLECHLTSLYGNRLYYSPQYTCSHCVSAIDRMTSQLSVWDGRDIYSHRHAQTFLLIQLRPYRLKVSSWH